MPFPKAYEIFPYYDHQYMIKPSELCTSGYGLFIHSIVVVTQDFKIEPLMPFCGPIYT